VSFRDSAAWLNLKLNYVFQGIEEYFIRHALSMLHSSLGVHYLKGSAVDPGTSRLHWPKVIFGYLCIF